MGLRSDGAREVRRNAGRAVVLLSTFVLLVARPALGQMATGCAPTIAQLKARMLELRATNPDDDSFFKAFDRSVGFDKVRLSVGVLPDAGVTLGTSDLALFAIVSPPYWRYSKSIKEALRKREPIESAATLDGVAVTVSPTTIDAPDIVKVILERDGQVIVPLVSTMTPTPLITRTGAKAILHQGVVVYPCSVFTPGGRIVLTLIPESGSNIVKTFDEFETWLLGPHQFVTIVPKTAPAISIATLKGLSAVAVRERIGNPTAIAGNTWTFATADHGTLQVFFLGDGTVSSALPNDFDLAWIQRK